jgi:hypothetical protein
MTSPFSVRGTPRFDRLLRKLTRKHPDLSERFAEAFVILSTDPYNSSGSYPIRKL